MACRGGRPGLWPECRDKTAGLSYRLHVYKPSGQLPLLAPEQRFSGAHARVVALFADIRGFSVWSEAQSLDRVAELVETQFERVVQIGKAHQHHFHKFLGDGFVVLWEIGREGDEADCLGHALAAARQLHADFHTLSRAPGRALPKGYGIAIAIGEAIRLQPNADLALLTEADFVGYPLNCAARLQSLAEAYGTVVCARAAARCNSGVGIFDLALAMPDPTTLARAQLMKGLKPEDREEFRFVSFPELAETARR